MIPLNTAEIILAALIAALALGLVYAASDETPNATPSPCASPR